MVAAALLESLGKQSPVFVDCHRLLHEAGEALVGDALAAGAVRADLEHGDLRWMAHGVARAAEGDGGPERTRRMLTVLLAGVRPRDELVGSAAPGS